MMQLRKFAEFLEPTGSIPSGSVSARLTKSYDKGLTKLLYQIVEIFFLSKFRERILNNIRFRTPINMCSRENVRLTLLHDDLARCESFDHSQQ